MAFLGDQVPPHSVIPVHFLSTTDPALDVNNHVAKGKMWIKTDNVSTPTWFEGYLRNPANDGWILLWTRGNFTAPAAGDVLYVNADGRMVALGIGSAGHVLTVASGLPSWAAAAGGGGTVDIEDEGAAEGAADTIDFTGAGVSVTFAAGKATVDIPGGAGGGWTQVVDEDGSSFANFTSVAGTWASNGTEITQTDTSASSKHARLTAELLTAYCVFEADVRIDSSGAGAISRVGLVAGYNGTIGASTIVYLEGNATTGLEVTSDSEASAELGTTSFSFNYDTFYTLRLVIAGNRVTAFVDGTQRLSVANTGGPLNTRYLALLSYGSAGRFQNIKMWRPVLPGE